MPTVGEKGVMLLIASTEKSNSPMAASFTVEGGAPAVSAARELFRVDGGITGEGDAYYDLAPDGEAFVVVEPLESGGRELRLIRGWIHELAELVPR